jgi:hypothetical protein
VDWRLTTVHLCLTAARIKHERMVDAGRRPLTHAPSAEIRPVCGLCAPALVVAILMAASACSSSDADSQAAVDAASDAASAVVEDDAAAFNAQDVVGVMATMSPAMDRVLAALVECEHQGGLRAERRDVVDRLRG